MRSILATAAAAVLLSLSVTPAALAGDDAIITGSVKRGPSTGLALPRFVSLKAGRVNLRIGPGRDYAVDWMYMKPGLPMEVIQEYDNWRRVRDAEGTEGWIYQSLLSGRRTGTAAPWQKEEGVLIPLRREPGEQAETVARVEPGSVGNVIACTGDWCEMEFAGHTGWISQSLVWGVYPGESVEN